MLNRSGLCCLIEVCLAPMMRGGGVAVALAVAVADSGFGLLMMLMGPSLLHTVFLADSSILQPFRPGRRHELQGRPVDPHGCSFSSELPICKAFFCEGFFRFLQCLCTSLIRWQRHLFEPMWNNCNCHTGRCLSCSSQKSCKRHSEPGGL